MNCALTPGTGYDKMDAIRWDLRRRGYMRFNWIDANKYTLDCVLLFDRWVLRWIFADCGKLDWFSGEGRDYKLEMAKALYRYPFASA